MNATGDGPDDLVRRIETDMSSWAPERGPRWADLRQRVEERPRQLFKVYTLAGAALAAILFGAYLTMAALNVGTLVDQPVVAQQIHK